MAFPKSAACMTAVLVCKLIAMTKEVGQTLKMLETMLLKVSTPLMLLPSIKLCIFTLLAMMSSAWLTSPEAQICSRKGGHQPSEYFFAHACKSHLVSAYPRSHQMQLVSYITAWQARLAEACTEP